MGKKVSSLYKWEKKHKLFNIMDTRFWDIFQIWNKLAITMTKRNIYIYVGIVSVLWVYVHIRFPKTAMRCRANVPSGGKETGNNIKQ